MSSLFLNNNIGTLFAGAALNATLASLFVDSMKGADDFTDVLKVMGVGLVSSYLFFDYKSQIYKNKMIELEEDKLNLSKKEYQDKKRKLEQDIENNEDFMREKILEEISRKENISIEDLRMFLDKYITPKKNELRKFVNSYKKLDFLLSNIKLQDLEFLNKDKDIFLYVLRDSPKDEVDKIIKLLVDKRFLPRFEDVYEFKKAFGFLDDELDEFKDVLEYREKFKRLERLTYENKAMSQCEEIKKALNKKMDDKEKYESRYINLFPYIPITIVNEHIKELQGLNDSLNCSKDFSKIIEKNAKEIEELDQYVKENRDEYINLHQKIDELFIEKFSE